MRALVVVVVVVVVAVACSGPKHDPVAPEPSDAACVAATTKLGEWLSALAAEGVSPVMSDGVTFAELDGETPAPIAAAPVVNINAREVTFQGRLLATVPVEDGKEIEDALAAKPAPDLLVVVDAAVPWSAVVATANAAALAGDTHLTFVFAAGIAGKTPPPPPSSVDRELDELAKPVDPSKAVAKLYDPEDPDRPASVPDKVFKACPVPDVFAKIANANTDADHVQAIAVDLPKAIAACGCKVEIASVQRLMWAWYRRDAGPPQRGVGVELATKAGTPVTVTAAPTAPWSEVGKRVATAAKAGKPLAFK